MNSETPLRAWRLDNRLKLADVAERVGTSIGHLCQVERGKKPPSVALARKLAAETGLSLDEVLRQ